MVFGIGILQEIMISAVLIFATVMGLTCFQWSQSPYTQLDLLMNDINSLNEGGQKLVQFDFSMPADYVILQIYGDDTCIDHLEYLNSTDDGNSRFVANQEDLEDRCEGKYCLCLYKLGFSQTRYFESYPDLTTYQDVQDNRTDACTELNKLQISEGSMYCKRIDLYQGPYPLYMTDYDGYPLHWIYMGNEGWRFSSTKFFWDTGSDYFRWFTIY